MDYTTSQKLDMRGIKSEEFQTDENGSIMPLYLAYRISRQEKNPRSLKVVMVDENPVVEIGTDDRHWILEIFNLPISKSIDEASSSLRKIIEEGWNYNNKLAEGLISYRTMKLLQDIEYKKQLEETEQPGSKKKKKRPVKGKTIEEPAKMTEYVPPPTTYPSKTFGPVMVEIGESTEEVYRNIEKSIDPLLLETLEGGMEVYVRNKSLKKTPWIFKANCLRDLTVGMKKVELPPVLDSLEQNLDS